MITVPLATWLLAQRGRLKAGAVALPGEQPGERFRALLVLDGLSDQEVIALFKVLGLAPLPEWDPVRPEQARRFFGLQEDPGAAEGPHEPG